MAKMRSMFLDYPCVSEIQSCKGGWKAGDVRVMEPEDWIKRRKFV